jgi:undecaprenyl-diphosphatase
MPKKNRLKTPLIHPTIHVFLAALLFVIAVLLSRGATMLEWEETLFLWIYNWPEFLTPFFIVVTWFGAIQVLGILLVIFMYQRKFNDVIRLLLTALLAYQLSGIAKGIWGRTRPNELLVNVTSRDFSYGPGFPSGHTALAVAMAFVVGHYLPKKYHWIVIVWIVGVALSRIYLGVHAPLDIIGGFAIGWFSYMLFRHVRLYPIKNPKRKNSK